MFEIIFGVFWTTITAVCTFGFYSGVSGTITVNGQIVSQEEFNAMLFPKIFMGLFWVIGIFMIITGFKKIIRNYKTNAYGEDCFGRILNIFKSGTYVNNIPELKATIAVYIESLGIIEQIDEVIGLATKVDYHIGDYIEGKYYNGDVNVVSPIPENAIPGHIQYKLKELIPNVEDSNTIVIDGVTYVRKDSIDQNY